MIRRAKFWLSVAVLFVVVNAAGVVMAAASRELLHTALHVLLLIPGIFIVTRFVRRDESGTVDADAGVLGERLSNLEQSVEAVAIEIERIGEAQRFMIKARGERVAQLAPDAGSREPIGMDVRDADSPAGRTPIS